MFEIILNNFSAVYYTAVMACTVVAVFFGMRGEVRILRHDVRRIEVTLEQMNKSLEQLNNVLTQVAVQDKRLQMLEKQLDELRHGVGFIKIKAP